MQVDNVIEDDETEENLTEKILRSLYYKFKIHMPYKDIMNEVQVLCSDETIKAVDKLIAESA